VHVDAGIHVLLQAIWAAGLETQFSCEGWPEDSHGAHLYGTHGYILFHTADQAIEFFRASHERSAARDVLCPHLVFETHIGMDIFQVRSADLPPRGVIRFRHTDLKELEELWTA
jgi:hypothetical protein